MQCFLIYIDDWLSSKKIEMMDRDEELAYFHMLMKSAKENDCGLPDDDTRLAIISGLGPQWFRPTRDKMKRFTDLTSGQKIRQSFESRDGRIYNERLVREWNHQKKVSEQRLAAGKLGGRPKKPIGLAKGNQTVPGEKPDGLANGKQNETNYSLGLGLVVGSKENLSSEFNIEVAFAEFICDWPDLSDLALAHAYYLDKVAVKPDPFAAHAKMLAAKERWVWSRRWHSKYHKSPGKWLAEDKEDDFPEKCSCGHRLHASAEAQARAGPGARSKIDQRLELVGQGDWTD